MAFSIPKVQLNDGHYCPVLGLGTYRAKENEAYDSVFNAIKEGYRHIDTAYFYENEVEIGRAVKNAISELNVKREELFIVTKLPNTCNRPHLVLPAIKASLTDLGLDYVDLYLIHTPVCATPVDENVVSNDCKFDENGDPCFDDINPSVIWKEMEDCVDRNLTKSIGVSNFNSEQVQSVLDHCRIKPVINQCECHPYLPQVKLIDFCRKNNIFVTSFRCLGGQVRKPDAPTLLDHKVVTEIAEKHNKTPAQVLLRWNIDRGLIVIAKAGKLEHIKANMNIFDFALTRDEVKDLVNLENGFRYCSFLNNIKSKQYPFHIEF